MTIEGNRWYVRGNEFSGGFMDWVVTIKPTFVGNGLLLRWEVILVKVLVVELPHLFIVKPVKRHLT